MSANESDVELFDFKQVQRIVSGYGIKAYTAQEKFCNNRWDRFHGLMHHLIPFSYNAYISAAHAWLPPGSFNIGHSNGRLVGHMDKFGHQWTWMIAQNCCTILNLSIDIFQIIILHDRNASIKLARDLRLAIAFGYYHGGELVDKPIIDAETNKNKGVSIFSKPRKITSDDTCIAKHKGFMMIILGKSDNNNSANTSSDNVKAA